MGEAVIRQLEGNDPHHQTDQHVDNALRLRRTQARSQLGGQQGQAKEPQERCADGA